MCGQQPPRNPLRFHLSSFLATLLRSAPSCPSQPHLSLALRISFPQCEVLLLLPPTVLFCRLPLLLLGRRVKSSQYFACASSENLLVVLVGKKCAPATHFLHFFPLSLSSSLQPQIGAPRPPSSPATRHRHPRLPTLTHLDFSLWGKISSA